MTIGSRLKKLRETNNFTQDLVAEYLNYTTEGYIMLENDKLILTVDVLAELCELYNCSEAYILHGGKNINNCMKNDSKEKEHVYGYGCKLHEDDPEIIHEIECGDIMEYDENIILFYKQDYYKNKLKDKLDIGERTAQKLVIHGFFNPLHIAWMTVDELIEEAGLEDYEAKYVSASARKVEGIDLKAAYERLFKKEE